MAMLFHDSQFESVLVHQNPALGYTGIIALHDTRPGPTIGGCRWMHYADIEKAIEYFFSNKKKIREFGEKSRELVLKNYDVKIISRKFLDLYNNILRKT